MRFVPWPADDARLHPDDDDGRVRIVLYSDLPCERRASMDRYARELHRALSTQAPELDVRQYVPPDALRLPGASPVLAKAANYHARFLRYPWLASHDRADIHHVIDHAYAHLAFVLGPAPIVVTCHDLMLLKMAVGEVPSPSQPRVATWMFRLAVAGMRRAARVIADSEETKRDLVWLANYPAERVRVVPLGVSDRFRRVTDPMQCEALRRRYGVPPRAFVVLHVGGSAAYKNVDAVLQTIACVRRTHSNACLLKVGWMSASDRRNARQLGIESAVIEVGDVVEEDLPGLYSLARCLLFPSFSEGFGLPPLESMACGTPVVVARAGAIPEVVGEAGLYAAPNDVEAMAAAVLSLHDPTQAAHFAERGRRRAREFTWADTARRTAAVYREVLRDVGAFGGASRRHARSDTGRGGARDVQNGPAASSVAALVGAWRGAGRSVAAGDSRPRGAGSGW